MEFPFSCIQELYQALGCSPAPEMSVEGGWSVTGLLSLLSPTLEGAPSAGSGGLRRALALQHNKTQFPRLRGGSMVGTPALCSRPVQPACGGSQSRAGGGISRGISCRASRSIVGDGGRARQPQIGRAGACHHVRRGAGGRGRRRRGGRQPHPQQGHPQGLPGTGRQTGLLTALHNTK